jgi:hypothetical protein
VIIYGLLRKGIILATKNDLCATCSTMGPHAIVRLLSWIEIFFIPIVPVWASHQLVCGRCGATRKLKRGQVNEALKTGKLPLEHRETFREYANWAFEETGRSPQESELDPIEINPSRGPWDRYLKLWLLIVPAAFVGLLIVGIMNP